jgi:hypothetical protein
MRANVTVARIQPPPQSSPYEGEEVLPADSACSIDTYGAIVKKAGKHQPYPAISCLLDEAHSAKMVKLFAREA